MSALLLGQVFLHEFEPAELLVMLCMADHAYDDGTKCFPSKSRIAWKIGYSERQVQRILAVLREKGVLKVVRPGGGRSSAEYAIHLDNAPLKAPYRPPAAREPAISEPIDPCHAPAPAAPIVTVPRRRDVNGDPLDPPPAPTAAIRRWDHHGDPIAPFVAPATREDDDQRIAREDDAERDQLRINADQKRAWWDHLCQLQGSPPFGAAIEQWHTAISDLIRRGVTPQEFSECWEIAKRKWKDGHIHMLSIYNHLGDLLPKVRLVRNNRTARAVLAEPAPERLTPQQQQEATQRLKQMREAAKRDRDLEEQQHTLGIHTRGHPANCLCVKCLNSKREWQRQKEAKKP